MNVLDTPLVTNDQSIDRLLRAGLPVLLVFSSGTLGAGLQRAMERIARERAGRLLVARAGVGDHEGRRDHGERAGGRSLVADSACKYARPTILSNPCPSVSFAHEFGLIVLGYLRLRLRLWFQILQVHGFHNSLKICVFCVIFGSNCGLQVHSW